MEMKNLSGKFRVTKVAPTKGIKPSPPVPPADASACEMAIQIGIFFDGTGNSLRPTAGLSARSNVVRIYQTYPDRPTAGNYSIYIPGLGTAFPSIGENSGSNLGSAFAKGGDGRILYAILRVIDSIHRSIFNSELFGARRITALCTADPNKKQEKIVEEFGLLGNLVDDDNGVRRKKFLTICLQDIERRMRSKPVPKINACSLDIFGFSRGATEARVFCHWMNDLLSKSSLAGIPVHFRFVGLMDTVASVGIWDGVTNRRVTGGHSCWATADMMRIISSVDNCVHFVAMHELRKSFPLDTVTIDDVLPSNCQEFAYPGSHSDIGGGYASGELGVSGSDALKLSQIPLNHMFDCAVSAGVPLSKRLLPEADKAFFTVDRELQNAFERFLSDSIETPRSLSDWVVPYLAWRWQVRQVYESLEQVQKANAKDRRLLLESNQYFCICDEQIKNTRAYADISSTHRRPFDRGGAQRRIPHLELEAPALRARVVAQPRIPPALAAFFDKFVHDSVAGFREQFIEASGHWRYRRVFRGSATPYIG